MKFLLLWIIFALLDPDPLTQLNPDPIRIRNPEKTPTAPGVVVEAVYDVPAHVEVEWVLGCLVQQVGGLHQLGSANRFNLSGSVVHDKRQTNPHLLMRN